jgi:hypothetical protein
MISRGGVSPGGFGVKSLFIFVEVKPDFRHGKSDEIRTTASNGEYLGKGAGCKSPVPLPFIHSTED